MVKHLGIQPRTSPRGLWLHWDYDDQLLKANPGLHLHIPIRDPMAVAASWGRRGKKIAGLLRAYASMFEYLASPHETNQHTLHRIEDIEVLDGATDWDRNESPGNVLKYQQIIQAEVVDKHRAFFAEYYPRG